MGYGNLIPVLPLARYLTFMEGIVGRFYVAVLVSSSEGIQVWRQKWRAYDTGVLTSGKSHRQIPRMSFHRESFDFTDKTEKLNFA
jgi:hypothetical protein